MNKRVKFLAVAAFGLFVRNTQAHRDEAERDPVIGEGGKQIFIKIDQPDLLGDQEDESSEYRYRKHGLAYWLDGLSQADRDKYHCRDIAHLYDHIPQSVVCC